MKLILELIKQLSEDDVLQLIHILNTRCSLCGGLDGSCTCWESTEEELQELIKRGLN
jgi:hypothetical protein